MAQRKPEWQTETQGKEDKRKKPTWGTGGEQMDTWFYEVVSIDGDYANLKRTDQQIDDLKLVARALLPDGIEVGSRLKYEMLSYEIV